MGRTPRLWPRGTRLAGVVAGVLEVLGAEACRTPAGLTTAGC
jgi:hypothetical protein